MHTPGSAPVRHQWLGLNPSMWLFIVVLCGLPFVGYFAMKTHAEKEALRDANQFSRLISLIRSYYNANVTQRILANNGERTVLSENYHQIDGAIPIPATLSIELGYMIRERELDDGFSMAFISDAPFLTRKREPLDPFQAEALAAFRQTPELKDMWRVVPNSQGGHDVRLAIPVRMEAGCVACHNGHPASPKRNWGLGDVRGIQDVTVAVQLAEQSEDSHFFVFYLLLFIGSTVYVLTEHRRSNMRLNSLNDDLRLSQSYLEDSEYQLKRQVDELTNLTTVLNKAPFGIAFTDPKLPDRPVIYANEAFAQLTGYTADELLGRPQALFPGPDTRPEAMARITQAIEQEQTGEIEVLFYRKDGEPYWNRLLTFPSYDADGWLLSSVLCFTDITALKRADQERQTMAGELQESLKLESLGLTIAGIAHDLNTPIGVALTASSHLERQAQKMGDSAQTVPVDPVLLQKQVEGLRKSVALINNNLGKAAALVRSFKQTTADASRHEWRPLELKPYLESLLLSVSPLLKRAQCELVLECPENLSVYTEPGSLMQVITNLLVNATVHAFDGVAQRCIWLQVTDHPGSLEIVIRDNGTGMTQEALNLAFTPFFTTRRQSGGSGLGLFSSRRAVEQVLGGRIHLESQPQHGTCFTILLPKKAPDGHAVPSTPTEPIQ
jgi:PAS domain S-box-containing protein